MKNRHTYIFMLGHKYTYPAKTISSAHINHYQAHLPFPHTHTHGLWTDLHMHTYVVYRLGKLLILFIESQRLDLCGSNVTVIHIREIVMPFIECQQKLSVQEVSQSFIKIANRESKLWQRYCNHSVITCCHTIYFCILGMWKSQRHVCSSNSLIMVVETHSVAYVKELLFSTVLCSQAGEIYPLFPHNFTVLRSI